MKQTRDQTKSVSCQIYTKLYGENKLCLEIADEAALNHVKYNSKAGLFLVSYKFEESNATQAVFGNLPNIQIAGQLTIKIFSSFLRKTD